MKDLGTGAVMRVSTTADGTQANGHSFHAHFTADGHGAVFESLATNLVPGTPAGVREVYLKNLDTGAVTLLSTDGGGVAGANNSYAPTQLGGLTAFESNADLTGGGAPGHGDIYIKDASGADLRISPGIGGAVANADLFHPQIASDGSAVLFQSAASNLVGGDANGKTDVFLARLAPAVGIGAVTENGVAATGSLYFEDGNAAGTHSVSVVAAAGSLGALSAAIGRDSGCGGVGRIDWGFAGQGFAALAAGEAATETFSVVVSDGAGRSAAQPVTVTLTGVNDPPVAADYAFHLNAGATTGDQSALLLANDTDIDHGDRLSISAIDTTGTLGTVALDPTTHQLTYAATGAAFASLAQGQSATDHFGYTVTDLSGATSHANVTVTIDGVAPAPGPVASGDTLTALPGGSVLDGTLGYARLIGGAGDDTLLAGSTTTTLSGGGGNDVFSVNAPGQLVVEQPGAGHASVVATISYTLPANVRNLYLVGGNLDGTGNGQGDHLRGTDGDNVLEGGAGAPSILEGGKGNDTYVIDNAGDQVIAGPGHNTVLTALSSYTLPANIEALVYTGAATQSFAATGNDRGDTIHGGDGGDALTGGAGNDSLTGGHGTNILDGGAGADTLRGGGGPTTFVERRGQAAGDFIVDFNTSNGGDKFKLVGWGVGTTVSAVGEGNWTITDGIDHHSETLKIIGQVHAGDVLFG